MLFFRFLGYLLIIYFFALFLELCLYKKNYRCWQFIGVPGSGKSTIAAYLVKKCNKWNNIRKFICKKIFRSKKFKDRTAMSNVPIKNSYELVRSDIGNYLIHDSDLIIDEAGLEFGNRDFKSFTKNEMKFFKKHRHYRCNIYMFSQGFDVDLKLRDLCTRLYLVEKSLIPFFIHCKKIKKYVGIDELTGQLVDKYKFCFGGFYVFAPKTWRMFKTHSIDTLPVKQFIRY